MRDVLTFSSLECLAQYVAKSAKTYGRELAITCARIDEDLDAFEHSMEILQATLVQVVEIREAYGMQSACQSLELNFAMLKRQQIKII